MLNGDKLSDLSPEAIIEKFESLSSSELFELLDSPHQAVRDAVVSTLLSEEVSVSDTYKENDISTIHCYGKFARYFEDFDRTWLITRISGSKYIEKFFSFSQNDIKPKVLLIVLFDNLHWLINELKKYSGYIETIRKVSIEVREDCALTNDDLKLIYTTLPDIQELCIEYIGNCAKELANGGLLNFKKLEYFGFRDPFCTNLQPFRYLQA